MKALCTLAAIGLALTMTSCSLTQQVNSDEEGSPEAKPLTKRAGNLFNTRGKKVPPTEDSAREGESKVAEAAPTEQAATAPAAETLTPVPTEAQQNAAQQLLAESAPAAAAPLTATEEADMPTDTTALPPSGRLRMGSIAPQEEAASASDAPPPGANSVDMHGLRSPGLPKGLPMNIDGKLNSNR